MTQDPNTTARQEADFRARNPRINLRELVPGTQVRLAGDITAEVVNNPQDGMWIFVKYLKAPSTPAVEGTEDQIFATDVVEVL